MMLSSREAIAETTHFQKPHVGETELPVDRVVLGPGRT